MMNRRHFLVAASAGGKGALDFSLAVTCAGAGAGSADSISDTPPATCGVAMLVPLYEA